MNYNKLTDYLDHLEEQYGIPSGDCIVCRKHQVLYRHSFGHSDYERKKPSVLTIFICCIPPQS